MTELTANQMADALRKCGSTIDCEGCPYLELGTARCIQQMQRDAAALIEGQKAILDRQTRTLDRLKAYVSNS